MSDTVHEERAGAVVETATGPEDAKALSPATLHTADTQLPLDETPPTDGAVGSGADLLDRVLAFVQHFVILPSEDAGVAVALWAAHTHLMSAWDTTPRLAFLSAEPGSGKSLAMRLTALMCPLALEASSATTASLVRALDDPEGRPTYFIDEIDTKYGPKAKGDEDLRCLINAGHGTGGFIMRNELVNNQWHPVKKSAFAAIAMAGIGNILPDTILTRSVVVKMRKPLPNQKAERYRQRVHGKLGEALRGELAAWADQVRVAASQCWPTLPDNIADRDEDVWGPLIVVADLAGGQWPDRARHAAISAVKAAKANNKPSLGIQLLTGIREAFGDRDLISSRELVDMLSADEEAPWGSFGRKGLEPRSLAEMLAEYDIQPGPIRPNGSTGSMVRGYRRKDFQDAWARHPSPI
nr:DUF3631 domain-containing protein [uncultured Sphingomonas sp.]